MTGRIKDATACEYDVTVRIEDVTAINDDVTDGIEDATTRNGDVMLCNDDVTSCVNDVTVRCNGRCVSFIFHALTCNKCCLFRSKQIFESV